MPNLPAIASHCPAAPNPGNGAAGQQETFAPPDRGAMRGDSGALSLKAAANRYFSRVNKRGEVGAKPDFAAAKPAPHGGADLRPPGAEKCPLMPAPFQPEAAPARRHKRSPAWPAPDDEPQPGDFCACCHGLLWWIETDAPKGWRCCRCYGPSHLQAGQFRVMAT